MNHAGRLRRNPLRESALVQFGIRYLVSAATLGATPAAGNPPTHPKAGARHADPSLAHRIHAVNAQLDRLSRQNDRLDEQYNLAAAAVTAAQRTAQRSQRAADRASARYRAAHARFVQAVTQQYEGGPSTSVIHRSRSTTSGE